VTCGWVRAGNHNHCCQAHLRTEQFGERADVGGAAVGLHVGEHCLRCFQVACTSAASHASVLVCTFQMLGEVMHDRHGLATLLAPFNACST
jgi:hypothetical protein